MKRCASSVVGEGGLAAAQLARKLPTLHLLLLCCLPATIVTLVPCCAVLQAISEWPTLQTPFTS